jgi:hypothetical protein
MEVCARCGKPGHDASACPMSASSMPPPGYSSMPPPGYSSMPPPGGSMPPGALGASGAYAASQNPVHRSLRLLKTQLNLAIGQREEDPERAWLEAVSVRERLEVLVEATSEDELLKADVERFRHKLEEQVKKLTRDIGDEVVAPLYSWVDLLRQRDKLEGEVEAARGRVAEARASRGAPPSPPLTTLDEGVAALDARESELKLWRADTSPAPPPVALAIWDDAGGSALRASMPSDPQVVRDRAAAARPIIELMNARPLEVASYAGSRLELVVLPATGAAALLTSMFAFARHGAHIGLSALAVIACGSFGAAAMASVEGRRRAASERRAALDLAWFHTLFTEQAASLELEVGWLRALVAALRARHAFDAHKGEGGQLAELAKWRPDLKEVVADVAQSSLVPPPPGR